MALNYDEAIAELRAEEKRLEQELEQVRAAIPGMIVLRNRSRFGDQSIVVEPPKLHRHGIVLGNLTGVGPTKGIQEVLKVAETPMNTREIFEAMRAQGWTTDAQKPVGVISATLIQLEKNGIAERVGESWRLKRKASPYGEIPGRSEVTAFNPIERVIYSPPTTISSVPAQPSVQSPSAPRESD